MGYFKWLHLSDLHFDMYEGFDINLILNRLREKLKKETEIEKFRYIFLSGDLANRYDYSTVEARVKELLIESDILEDNGKIFWACGNHDIIRTFKSRKRVIEEIREKAEKDVTFENEFADVESRAIILNAFNEYHVKRKELFGLDNENQYPHQIIHDEDVEIILLNTCLTSCDDNDDHNLYICEPELIKLFQEIEPGKPVFVLGHHSISLLANSEERRILSLFQEKNVSVYLCGHSHRLGVRPLAENIWEIVSGGFKTDGYATISFFIGMYDESQGGYKLIPYTYRKESLKWEKDYHAVWGMEEDKIYQVTLQKKENINELSDIIIRVQKLFQGGDFAKLNVKRFNQIGERILQKYVKKILNNEYAERMDYCELCDAAVQNGNQKINYSSLKMTESMKDIWRFRENLISILRELGMEDMNFPILKEVSFDFNDFFDAVNRFDLTENTYVLVTDAIHDMGNGQKKRLAEFRWDVILDYDGHSLEGGLRGCALGQNIKDLNCMTFRQTSLRRGITSWVQIGEQAKFALSTDENGMDLRKIKNFYEDLVQKLYINSNGAIVFVFIKDIEIWDKELMRIAWERFDKKVGFVMVGAFDKYQLELHMQNLFLDSFGKKVSDCYNIFQTPLAQFLNKYSKYSENFLEQQEYEVRQFPSNNGLEKLEQNLYVNLEDFFEVLTSEIGMDMKHHKEEIDTFYLGGEAAWSLFYSKDILNLVECEVEDELIHKLKTVLGAKQEQPRNAVFYFLHEAGYGGTTAAKGIAWKMHKDHPTLLLKSYEYGKIKPLIQNLYDNHTRKGILIVADESRFSVSDLENLEREICLVDRPFALLVVKRLVEKNINSTKNVKRLNLLTNQMVNNLKSRFREKSHLDPDALEEKDAHFDEAFPHKSGMCCPFLIGLYYQDRWFNGVSGYVGRIVDKVNSEGELKALLVLGIINRYGRIGVTKDIIRKYISLSSNSDYLEKYPYAKEAFIGTYDETIPAKLYREKHFLISEEIIKQCSEKLYRGDYQESLKTVLIELIMKILEINSRGITLYYKNLLERLFIYKNATDLNDRGYTEVTEFSPLILAVPSQISREEVMHALAQGVTQVVEGISVDGNELYFKMAAHICGHLGRLYKASTVSMEQMQNSKKSIEWCEKAEDIMRRGQFEDAYIYHMHGTSLSKQCLDRLNAWKSGIESCSDEDVLSLEADVQKALDKFDQTILAGEFVRGCVSKLSLLMEYVGFLVKWKKIDNSDQIQKLSARERDYIKVIDDLIDMLEDTVLDTKDENRLYSLKNSYRAEVMFNNYGKAIEYYTNAIYNMVREKGEDANELYVLRSGLAGAILGKYLQESKNPYLDMSDRDVDRILETLEKNIFSTVALSDRWERQRRCNDCHRWLKVAKQSSISVQIGIKVAEKWKELQKEAVIKDPRPYYYLTVLHYLNALDGYSASLEFAWINQRDAYKTANSNSVFRVINIEKIRDILLDGRGMNRMKSVGKLTEDLDKDVEKAIRLKGKFLGNDDKNPKIGTINVVFPQELRNAKVYFKMGDKNTISTYQTGHMLEFAVGFTFERLEAINSTVKDVTNK